MSLSRPLISIITPSFNKADFIERCLSSVQSQSYPHWEHIVVDGGSTDRTLDILKAYPSVKYISEPDRGMYDAVNKGIRMSKGDVIAYLNCDDRYFPNTLETAAPAFAQSDDVDFVYGHCSFIDKSGKELYSFRSPPFSPYLIASMARFPWSQPSAFWRRRVHDQVGFFDTSFKIIGDLEFFQRMVRRGLRGKLVRAKLSQFMLANSFASQESYHAESERLASMLGSRGSLRTMVGRVAGEALFKLINLDNYVRRYYARTAP